MRTHDLETMVKRVSWFSTVDYEIWRFMDDHRIAVTANVISLNIDYDNDYVGKRLRTMTEAGLMVRKEPGVFEISELGEKFLEDKLTTDDLEDLNPNEKPSS